MEESSKEIKDWDDLNLPIDLLRGIYAYGFEKPSKIQSLACIHLIKGKDILAQAQSGTGKTGAFTIGALAKVDPQRFSTQIVILSPTRELALQTTDVIANLSIMMKLNIKTLIGGSYVDIYELKNNPPHVVVGTPGRVAEMLYKNVLCVGEINLVILDEADELFFIWI
jgi:translation initiation factor 4A